MRSKKKEAKETSSCVWWHTSVIQLLRGRRQEDHTIKACLGNLGPVSKLEVKVALRVQLSGQALA